MFKYLLKSYSQYVNDEYGYRRFGVSYDFAKNVLKIVDTIDDEYNFSQEFAMRVTIRGVARRLGKVLREAFKTQNIYPDDEDLYNFTEGFWSYVFASHPPLPDRVLPHSSFITDPDTIYDLYLHLDEMYGISSCHSKGDDDSYPTSLVRWYGKYDDRGYHSTGLLVAAIGDKYALRSVVWLTQAGVPIVYRCYSNNGVLRTMLELSGLFYDDGMNDDILYTPVARSVNAEMPYFDLKDDAVFLSLFGSDAGMIVAHNEKTERFLKSTLNIPVVASRTYLSYERLSVQAGKELVRAIMNADTLDKNHSVIHSRLRSAGFIVEPINTNIFVQRCQ